MSLKTWGKDFFGTPPAAALDEIKVMSRRQKKEAKVDEEFGDFFGETVDGNQKSDDHQLRLVGFSPLFTRYYTSKRW